jgi:hypothetical protein
MNVTFESPEQLVVVQLFVADAYDASLEHGTILTSLPTVFHHTAAIPIGRVFEGRQDDPGCEGPKKRLV